MLTSDRIQDLAHRLDEAARGGVLIRQVSADIPDLAEDDGYAIQAAGIGLRLARGERHVGMKMGLTSRAKMEQMGVRTPIYGYLTDAMRLDSSGVLPLERLSHPRVEPEICFLLERGLRGPVSGAEALAAVGGVCVALEIIDSRYEAFKFSLPDVIADNASSAFFVLGNTCANPREVPLDCLGVVLEINGQVRETGSSAAVYDHPARSLAEQANQLARRGQYLRAGHIVLTGGVTAAVALQPGDRVRACVDRLGTVTFRVGPARDDVTLHFQKGMPSH